MDIQEEAGLDSRPSRWTRRLDIYTLFGKMLDSTISRTRKSLFQCQRMGERLGLLQSKSTRRILESTLARRQFRSTQMEKLRSPTMTFVSTNLETPPRPPFCGWSNANPVARTVRTGLRGAFQSHSILRTPRTQEDTSSETTLP